MFASLAGAQSVTGLSNYYNSIILYNPAYAGAKENIQSLLFYKNQWNPFSGNPVYSGINVHGPFNYQRFGIGLSIVNESAGIQQFTHANVSVSYKINFLNGRLSFGARSGGVYGGEDDGSLTIKDPDDPVVFSKRFYADMSSGIFFMNKKYFAGLSFSRNAGVYRGADADLKNYYYMVAGVEKQLSDALSVLPSVFARYTEEFPVQVSVTVPVEYKDLFWLGASYKMPSAFSVLTGLCLDRFIPGMSLGYAYEKHFGNNYQGLSNTHEIVLWYNFQPSRSVANIMKQKITVSPLFFN